MEVDQYNYRHRLLDILTNISNASFITFDLWVFFLALLITLQGHNAIFTARVATDISGYREMSGIKKTNKQLQEKRRAGPKPTLEENYLQTKEAAEAFQVLQVGICCVEEDREKGFYLARPYNFNLSPLEIDTNFPRFDMDRQLQFSGSACKFLETVQFDFGKVFRSGVPYLSRPEELEIRNSKLPGQTQSSSVIELMPGDPKLEFYNSVKQKVIGWKETPKSDFFLNINHPNGPHLSLNGLQRRLIYQLIEKEFPEYQAKNGDREGSWMQIIKVDKKVKAQKTSADLEKFKSKLAIQIGLRWVIEALVNGNMDNLPVEWFYMYDSQDPKNRQHERRMVDDKLSKLKKQLKEKKHIIVGHNLFTDLSFLYTTFIGSLPTDVASFRATIHKVLPFVLDTKYIASDGQDSMSSQPKLKELLRDYKKLEIPKIYLHEEHTSYDGMQKEHEAGFDSWMTAELFLKLSLKLYNKTDFQDTASDHDTAYGSSPKLGKSNTDNEDLIDLSGNPESSLGNSAKWHDAHMQGKYQCSGDETDSPKPSPVKLKLRETKVLNKSSLATQNPFSLLDQMSEDESDLQESPAKEMSQKSSITSKKHLPSTSEKLLKKFPSDVETAVEEAMAQKKTRSIKQWLPGIDSPFWEPYMNKLRVNAADSGVCDLASVL